MNFFRFLTFLRPAGTDSRRRRTFSSNARRRSSLSIELLENRVMPSANPLVISGFVYNDANHDGLFSAGETPFANSQIELLDANGSLVATTTTDGNGFYQFASDPRIPTTPSIITQNASFPDTPTDWTQTASVPQFDPSLGTLTSVEIINQDPITSDIKVENLSPKSNTITATISGTLTLTGPGLAPTGLVTAIAANQSWDALPFDNTQDFAGQDFHDFGAQTAHGSNTTTVTDPNAVAAFLGTGSLTFTEQAQATSSAKGSGNVGVLIQTSAAAELTVIYHYTPSNGLRPGNYTIVQMNDPSGFVPGQTTSGNITPIPNSAGTHTIHWTNGVSSPGNNNFAELAPSSLSGHVFVDGNDNGARDPGEAPIAGSKITLTGTDDLGTVSRSVFTGTDGSYTFANLRPGTYTIAQDEPAGVLDGPDIIGSLGGVVSHDQFSAIGVGTAASGVNYDFGEVQPASIAGFVYVDANNNGTKDSGEAGIANVTVTLSGRDDLGNTVAATSVKTGADGSYQFTGLRPGTYTITETQPVNFLQGKNSVGSQGGTNAGNDQLTALVLNSGVNGVNNNFGELTPATLSGFVYADANNDGIKQGTETGIANSIVTLTGTDDLGSVTRTAKTGADGAYSITNLRPGTYKVTQDEPPGFLDGKDTIGTQGGTAGPDQLSGIVLSQGANGSNNNFGELQPASLSGFVYVDGNKNGARDPGEAGIGNVTVTLTGTDDLHNPVLVRIVTAGDGSYAFNNLRPGQYSITEAPTPAYDEGTNTVGSQGGTLGADQITNIVLSVGVNGTNNNFGEVNRDPPFINKMMLIGSNLYLWYF